MSFLLILLFILFIAGFFIYTLLFRNNIISNYSKIEVMKKTNNNTAYLVQNGLPFHTYFNYKSAPRYYVNDNWTFSAGNSRTQVNLPHCFNTPNSELRFYNGKAEYIKVLYFGNIAFSEDEHIHLVFDGSFYRTKVWLDNVYLGENLGGYSQFRFDITEHVAKKSKGVLKVEVDNTLSSVSIPPELYKGHALGWHPFGGIHKDVYIEVCPSLYVFKCHVTTENILDSPTARVNLLFHNPDSANAEGVKADIKILFGERIVESGVVPVLPAEGNGEIWEANAEFSVPGAKLWSSESPNNYTLRVETPYEKFTVNFGFRITEVIDREIRINDNRTIFNGVCRHEEDEENGLAQSIESMEEDFELINDMGANFARLSHYPQHPHFLDMCDRRGIYAWEEIPLYQAGIGIIKYYSQKSEDDRESTIQRIIKLSGKIMKTRQMTDYRLVRNACTELARMIERDYNHPSIAFWGVGNECWSLTPQSSKALKKLKSFVYSLDKSRLAAYAMMAMPVKGLSGRFERSIRVMDIVAVNEYFGWYYGEPSDVRGFLYSISKKMKGKPFIISETGADCVYGEHTDQIKPMRGYSEEYQDHMLNTQYKILKSIDGFSGLSVWVLKDFYCPEYKTDNPIPYYNLKGIVDKDRKKKKAFYSLKKIYEKEKENWTKN